MAPGLTFPVVCLLPPGHADREMTRVATCVPAAPVIRLTLPTPARTSPRPSLLSLSISLSHSPLSLSLSISVALALSPAGRQTRDERSAFPGALRQPARRETNFVRSGTDPPDRVGPAVLAAPLNVPDISTRRPPHLGRAVRAAALCRRRGPARIHTYRPIAHKLPPFKARPGRCFTPKHLV